MNSGCINAQLFNHNTRESVIEYLGGLDLTSTEKNGFYVYWKGIIARKKIQEQMIENKRLAKLRKLRR
jgi:hypothetical protein